MAGSPVVCPGGATCVAGACPMVCATIGLPGPPQVNVGAVQRTVAIADLDGDGRPELVTANHFGSDLSVLLSTCFP